MLSANNEIKRVCDRILYEFGLFDELKKIGTPHIVGSYIMDMMVGNDLDIDVENDRMSLEKLYDLTAFVIKTFKPTWYEAKQEVNNGNTVWFHGFEFQIEGELFNVDIWFFNWDTIENAEAYCRRLASQATGEQRNTIIKFKRELINRGLYRFDRYTSMHVYEAVLEKHITDIDQMLNHYLL